MKADKVVVQHTKNFQTLGEAFKAGQVALVECRIKATGEVVATICTTYVDDQGEINFVPFATFLNGNPYELLDPPNPEGGF